MQTRSEATSGSQGRAPAGETVGIGWRQPGGLLALSLANWALRLLTLGVYHFWGKTEVRKRIWSAVRLDGEPLEYTGTGRELLTGFLVVFAFVVLPVMLGTLGMMVAFGPQSVALAVWQVLLYAAFFYLAGVGTYRAQRYRLSRTRWRGVRCGLVDDSWSYGWTYVWTALLVPLTLGWIIPWRATKLQGSVTRRTSFGSRLLRFDAEAGPLYLRFAGLWLGALLIMFLAGGAVSGLVQHLVQTGQITPGRTPGIAYTLLVVAILAAAYLVYGIVSAWYRAGQINHFAAHTHFEGATFGARATAGGLVWLAVSNFLIRLSGLVAVLALVTGLLALVGGLDYWLSHVPGPSPTAQPAPFMAIAPAIVLLVMATGISLFSPITQARTARYLAERLTLHGDVDLTAITQGEDAGMTRGEGLAQAFDIDAF